MYKIEKKKNKLRSYIHNLPEPSLFINCDQSV